MIASDGLTLGTALAQLKNLKREFDALEAATSRARHQLDCILEQFESEAFEQSSCNEDDQLSAFNGAAFAADPESNDKAGNPSDTAASIIERTFNDDVDSLFDAELLVDDALGGSKYDEIELATADDDISNALGAAYENASAAGDIAINKAAPEDHVVIGDDTSASEYDAGTTVSMRTPNRELSLEQLSGEDDTEKLIACLSLSETDNREAMCDSSDNPPAAGAIALVDVCPSELNASMTVGVMNPATHDDDDLKIMASSMHQPVMEFTDAQMLWTPDQEVKAIFQLSDDDDASGPITSDLAIETVAEAELEAIDADEGDEAGQLGIETDAASGDENLPDALPNEGDAPATTAEMADDDGQEDGNEGEISLSEPAGEAANKIDNVVALTKSVEDDPLPPRRRGRMATAVLGASAIAATLAIAPQYVPMDSFQHLPPVQDLIDQLSQLKQFLA